MKSALNNLPDLDATTAWLQKNQDDIGNMFANMYGKTIGDNVAKLLHEHIAIAAQIVGAAKNGSDFTVLMAAWNKNADDIAAAFASVGLGKYDDLRQMMREHLDLTATSLTNQLSGKWQDDCAQFDEIRNQAMKMADMCCQ